MRMARLLAVYTGIGLLGGAVSPAGAEPLLRHQVDQNGDFVLFGNTLGYECWTGSTPEVPSPVVGEVDCL